ncbi:MAG: radical SAM protein [Methanobacterium sp.]|nr:radical SAM protein [Methanobacterium sp.]
MLTEQNVVIKNPRKVDLRFASCYPNLYKAAMSSLGFHIIYDFLNSREDIYCERVVYPYIESLESNTKLSEFDIVSFSLQYEQDYFNVLKMLDKSGINIQKDNRNADDPFIIAGGPCASSNPLPMSKFIDLFVIGEAEAVLDEVIDKYMELDNPKKEIDAFLDIDGVYVPDNPAKMVIVNDMDNACHPIRQIVPKTDDKRFVPAFKDAFLLGVSRGCTRGCRFCMAGCIYRPRRETPLKKLFKVAEKGIKATGFEKVALIGADVSGYSKIEELCEGLLERGFKITSPSMRIESITENLLDILHGSGLKTITIAPESTWKLRTVLNKPITDSDIYKVMEMAFKRNMNVKLYFLVGLPTETTEDVYKIVEYIKNLNKMTKKKNAIRISVNSFIPKPHTPFQWEKFDFDDLNVKYDYLNQNLKNINLKIEDLKGAHIQHVLSVGDVEIGDLIEKTYKKKFKFGEWKNIKIKRDLNDYLPWKNIDVGVGSKFLKNEYQKALKGDITPWCETFGCYECGACDKLNS